MPIIGLIANIHSGKNKRNPRIIEQFRKILGSKGELILSSSLEKLPKEVLRLKQENVEIIAINGGDGTVHQTITAIFQIYGDEPWPKIAILKGGTMNNIARNVGIPLLDSAHTMLRTLVESENFKTIIKHPLIVDEKYAGFIYGTAGIATFLEEYYENGNTSVWKAAWMSIRSITSAFIKGPYSKRIFASKPITIQVDNKHGKNDHYNNLGISTLSDLGFYLKPFYETISRPDIAHLITMNCSPLNIVFALPKMWRAKPTQKSYIEDLSGQRITLTFGGEQSYTLDGDLYPVCNQQNIRIGPPINFITGKQ
jgi:diacylglycerol kinase (ATP)